MIGEIEPIYDGFAKHTYKISVDRKPCGFQIWKEPDRGLTSNSDFGLFSGNVENLYSVAGLLKSVGISTPDILFSDIYKAEKEYPCILMEFIDGATPFQMPELFTSEGFVTHLASDFGKMNSLTRDTPGLIAVGAIQVDYARSCFLGLQTELATGSKYSDAIRQYQGKIGRIAETLFGKMIKSDRYSLVHGDLKPNHFILSEEGRLYWLDLEGCKYFDVEFEISEFLMPFSFTNSPLFLESYYAKNPIKPNQSRLAFYKLYRLITSVSACAESVAKSVFVGGADRQMLSKIVELCEKQIKEEYL